MPDKPPIIPYRDPTPLERFLMAAFEYGHHNHAMWAEYAKLKDIEQASSFAEAVERDPVLQGYYRKIQTELLPFAAEALGDVLAFSMASTFAPEDAEAVASPKPALNEE